MARDGGGGFPGLGGALLALAAAGLASGLAVLVLVLQSDHVDDRGITAAVTLIVGWSFVGTGLIAWWRRPANRTGALMTAVGFAWFATGVSAANDELVHTVGIALDGLFAAIAGHLLLAFPSGRLHTAGERALVALIYASATVLQLPSLLFDEEPRNRLDIHGDQAVSDIFDGVQAAVAVIGIGLSCVILVRRRQSATPPQQRALDPVLWTGGAAFAMFAAAIVTDAAGVSTRWIEPLAFLLLAAVPFGFLAGLLRSRLTQAGAVSELVARLGGAPEPGGVRAALADALGDPSLELAYWLPGAERYVDVAGRPVAPANGRWTEVELRGRRVAAIRHDPALAEEPQLVRAAGAAAALALENERLAAELRARIEELHASRARLVEAGDVERRKIERDLHDGAQARMVALAVRLGSARRKADGNPELTALLDESRAELQASLDELRELARGIHPAVLTDRGLDAALRSLAIRAPLPVEIGAGVPGDLPAPAATAVYFVVAEALTNVAKYASAEQATVR